MNQPRLAAALAAESEMPPLNTEFVLLTSPGMESLARSVQQKLAGLGLRLDLHLVDHKRFANGEYLERIPETVRRQHVFYLQDLLFPDPNNAFMQMMIALNALKYASVAGITLVIPYIPYLRQDRKDKPRVPITARMLADLIEVNKKVEHIITLDMHAEQEQGFFSIPVDNLTSRGIFAKRLREILGPYIMQTTAASPDFGGAVRTSRFAEELGIGVAICEKQRIGPNQSKLMSVRGESVNGRLALLYDDIIDTGGTTINSARSLQDDCGAKAVYATASHGVFSAKADVTAESRFAAAKFQVLVTDSIPRDAAWVVANPWLTIVSIDELLANTIYQHTIRGGSVSKLS